VSTDTPTQARKRAPWVVPAIASVAAFGLGAAFGSGSDSGAESSPSPTPTVITKEVTVEKVSEACLDALNDADELLTISGEVATLVGAHLSDDKKLFNQFAEYDFAADWYLANAGQFTASINDLTDRVLANTYQGNRDACRGAA